MKTRNGHKTYPLNVAQKFHIYYMDFCPKKEVLNIGTSLTIEYELDIEELKRAVYKAYERCESMRVVPFGKENCEIRIHPRRRNVKVTKAAGEAESHGTTAAQES